MKAFLWGTGSALAAVACAALAPGAHAQTAVFDFDTVASGTRTPLSLTSNGITGNFTASSGTFVVQNTAGSYNVPFSGNALASSASSQTLIVTLSQSVDALSVDFGAMLPGATVTVQLFASAIAVGSQTFTTTETGTVYQGSATFGGTKFDSIQIFSNSPAFAIDNLQVQATAAPEPGTVGLLAASALPTVGIVVRRRK